MLNQSHAQLNTPSLSQFPASEVDKAGGVATIVPMAQHVSALSMLLDVFL